MVIKVSYAAMEQANAQIIQISGTIAEKLDLLQQGLAKMVWVGGDAEAYARYKRDWDKPLGSPPARRSCRSVHSSREASPNCRRPSGGRSTTAPGSSPIVAGVAALVRAKFPQLHAADVVNRLIGTADDAGPPGRDPRSGSGPTAFGCPGSDWTAGCPGPTSAPRVFCTSAVRAAWCSWPSRCATG
jgi:hypothetical protein